MNRITISNQYKKIFRITSVFMIVSSIVIGCGKTSITESPDTTQITESEKFSEESEGMAPAAENGFPEQMPTFTAKDLNGDTITEAIFSEKDLTVVNIWGTFCSPCVAEMPELGEWAASMPDNVQIIGLIVDIAGDEDTKHHDLAVTITEKAEADFTHIIANADFDSVLRWVVGVPTTLFVDKEGKIVGQPIVGADVEGYQTFVEDYLNGQNEQ